MTLPDGELDAVYNGVCRVFNWRGSGKNETRRVRKGRGGRWRRRIIRASFCL